MKKCLLFVYVFVLLLVVPACAGLVPTPPPEAPAADTAAPADWVAVYFSRPGSEEAGRQRGGPDAALVSAIDGARISVEAAIYDLNLWSVRDALLDAHRRGFVQAAAQQACERAQAVEHAPHGLRQTACHIFC